MFELRVEGHFSAAHQVKGYPGDCAGTHGHTYRVQVLLKVNKLNKLGMATDFRKVQRVLDSILRTLDHRNLNSIQFFRKHNATAEWIGVYIFNKAKQKIASISSVTVWEGFHNEITYYEE